MPTRESYYRTQRLFGHSLVVFNAGVARSFSGDGRCNASLLDHSWHAFEMSDLRGLVMKLDLGSMFHVERPSVYQAVIEGELHFVPLWPCSTF